jgi:hypothetical protein
MNCRYGWGRQEPGIVETADNHRLGEKAEREIVGQLRQQLLLDRGFRRQLCEGDVAVFLVSGIEQLACTGSIVSVPLDDIKDLLTDEAVDYFPSLKF